MNSVGTFIQMFDNFLGELTETFPDNKALSSCVKKYDLFKDTNQRKVLDVFVATMHPYHDLIINKNDTLMTMEHAQGSLLKDMDINGVWNSDDCSTATKEAIWAHISSLYMFATTINMIPSNLMSSIEQLAGQYASGMTEDSMKDLKPELLMSNMQTLMKSLGQ